MKTKPFPRLPTDTRSFATTPRDEHRYRAEHPSRVHRSKRFPLQRVILYLLLALMLLGLFASF